MWKQGKRGNQSENIQLYLVLAVFYKHYNKWYIFEDNTKVWDRSFLKGEYIVLTCMVEGDNFFGNYEDVLVEISNEWNAHSIYVLKDTCYVISVRETLHNK